MGLISKIITKVNPDATAPGEIPFVENQLEDK